MSTGYGWEGVRQIYATLLGARHVPERLCGGSVYLGRYNKCSTFTFYLQVTKAVSSTYIRIWCLAESRCLSVSLLVITFAVISQPSVSMHSAVLTLVIYR